MGFCGQEPKYQSSSGATESWHWKNSLFLFHHLDLSWDTSTPRTGIEQGIICHLQAALIKYLLHRSLVRAEISDSLKHPKGVVTWVGRGSHGILAHWWCVGWGQLRATRRPLQAACLHQYLPGVDPDCSVPHQDGGQSGPSWTCLFKQPYILRIAGITCRVFWCAPEAGHQDAQKLHSYSGLKRATLGSWLPGAIWSLSKWAK